jgi:hypothetical protein
MDAAVINSSNLSDVEIGPQWFVPSISIPKTFKEAPVIAKPALLVHQSRKTPQWAVGGNVMNTRLAILLSFLMMSSTLSIFAVPARANGDAGVAASASIDDSSAADNSAYFVSPITDFRYQIVSDPSSGGTTYRLGTTAYTSIDGCWRGKRREIASHYFPRTPVRA